MSDTAVRGAYRFGPFSLDVRERRLWREDQLIPLRLKVFDTLLVLVENAGRLVTKQQLLDAIWPNTAVEENSLNHNVSVLRKALGEKAGEPQWYAMSERIEALVKAEKKLNPNVDFYSATMFYSLGISVDLYTPIFAVSRISGWTAHVLEQYKNNRLIRPRTDYIGPQYPQQFLPLDQR